MGHRLARGLARVALRRPWSLLVLAALVSVPAAWQASRIRLDTDLERLLPSDSRAVRWSRELETVVGDGGYFSLIFEGDDQAALDRAVAEAARAVAALPEVRGIEYQHPVAFIRRHKYTLLPSRLLEDVLQRVDRLEAEVNPFVEDLEEDTGPATHVVDEGELDRLLERWVDPPATHRSADGRLRGILVWPRRSVTSLGSIRDLHARLESIVSGVAHGAGVRAGVSGSLRKKVDAYLQIRDDLNRSGLAAGAGIVFVLLLALRSLRLVPIVLAPVAAGLLWSYGLVPALVGDLNLVTSFLLMVLFGTGVEFSVHLFERFRHELASSPAAVALETTFASTGRSIVTSGLATTLGMAVLLFSRFRGFSEFGVIAAISVLAIFLAMFVVLPPVLVLAERHGLVRPRGPGGHHWRWLPDREMTAVVLALVVLAGVTATSVRFDFDFEHLQAEVPAAAAMKEKHRQVYAGFTAPAAVYAASDLASLDAALAALDHARAARPDAVGTMASVRDFAPGPEEWARRRRLLAELQERLSARWADRIQDARKRRWIEDLRAFTPPDAPLSPQDLPPEILRRVATRDGSGGWTLAVNTASRPRDGQTAMAFTEALYALPMPEGVRGPTGDKPVFAEILWLVTREGPLLVGGTFLGVFLLVMADRRRIGEALWVMLPLAAGLLLTLGGMVALGWKLNFFNIVVLPNLIGNAVDNGVHWYRRWTETGHATADVQAELSGTLTASAATTAIGYAGLTLAHHAGLRSIGSTAVLGFACLWATAVVLMPGVLALRALRRDTSRAAAPSRTRFPVPHLPR